MLLGYVGGWKVRGHSNKAKHDKDVKVKEKGVKTTRTDKFPPPEVHVAEIGQLKLDQILLNESGRTALVSRTCCGGLQEADFL